MVSRKWFLQECSTAVQQATATVEHVDTAAVERVDSDHLISSTLYTWSCRKFSKSYEARDVIYKSP